MDQSIYLVGSNFQIFNTYYSDRCCFHKGMEFKMGEVIEVTYTNCTEVKYFLLYLENSNFDNPDLYGL